MQAQPLAFFHFRVRLYHRGRMFRAYLLSLNESQALFALNSQEYLQVDPEKSIRGSVDSKHGPELEFHGAVERKEGLQIRGQYFYTVAVRFLDRLDLSDRLLATTLPLD